MSSYRQRTTGFDVLIASVVLVVLLAVPIGLLVWWFWPHASSGLDPHAQPRPVVARGALAPEEEMNISIYDRTSPSVVHVTNLAQQRGLFNLNMSEVPKGTGSGYVWDEDGHIVTNYHVVAGADAAQVVLADNSRYRARQVWAYADKDIAVLWIDAPKAKLHPMPLIGTSHDLKVGQITYAIGNPFGFDQTMTNGIVSGLGREIEGEGGQPLRGVIQTSAAINPGNSGGPLLDSNGRLIGMNTAIVSPSGASAGIGFAIPVDEINEIVPQLIQHGKVVRPRLGVQLAEDQQARHLGIDEGALILKVVPDGSAAKAGLQGGDVILAVDGKTISKAKDLYAALEPHHVGDTITVTILRDNKRQDVKVTLEAAS